MRSATASTSSRRSPPFARPSARSPRSCWNSTWRPVCSTPSRAAAPASDARSWTSFWRCLRAMEAHEAKHACCHSPPAAEAHGHHGHAHRAAAPRVDDPAAIYTCPMHLEVRQVGPGSCPICGMALEPVDAAATDEADPELRDMTRRLVVSIAPSLVLLIVGMSDMLPGRPVSHALPHGARAWLELLLATPVVLWGGAPFFARGLASLRSGNLNMFTLIAL